MSDAQTKPNILLFFTDQQRWDTCGCYGQRLETTPNLDRLAAEGVRFENTFTCQPVCGPARACLQTGLWATQIGCYRNGVALPQDAKTIAHWLTETGYDVGYVGKWHLASGRFGTYYTGRLREDSRLDYQTKPIPPELRGGYKDFWIASDVLEFTSHGYDGHMFDADGRTREFPEGRYRADAQTDFVLEFLRSRAGQQRPFFFMTSYIEPHHQNDHQHHEGPHGSKERFAEFDVPGDLADTEGNWREEYPDYLGCIHALDKNLGRIRDELERLGLAENTLILFTSDHGSHFRTRNQEYKRSCHDGCVRLPLVVHGPGFRGGRVIEELVSLLDLPPTLLTAGGVEVPSYMGGRALQPLADGTAEGWPEEVFLQISESHCGRAIRTRRWKYSVRAPEGAARFDTMDSDVYVEDFLYDLDADPHERNNLIADPAHATTRADLAAVLKRRMIDAGEREPEIRPSG